jgi:hypothetical protein
MLLCALLFRVSLAEGGMQFSSAQLALLGSAAILFLVINRWRKTTVNKRNMPSSAAASSAAEYRAVSPLSVREITLEIQALLADLEETSRRLTAQLDNRYTRLEQLLAEADERIRKLESMGGHHAVATEQTTLRPAAEADTLPFSLPSAPSVPQPAISPAQRALARLRQERGAPPAAEDPAYQPIYSLADKGQSPRDIAKELGRQPGEIELILALRQHV